MSSLDVDVVHPFSISHTFCVTFGGLVVNVCVLCNVCLRIFMTSARVECWRPVTERVGHFCTNINNILFVKDVARRHIKNGNGKMKNSYLTLSLFRIYSLLCWHEMPAAHPHAQTATTIRHSWPEWVSVWLEFLRVHARDWASCGASHALFRHAFCTDVHHHVRIGSCSSCLAITRSARHVKMLRFSFVRPNGISCGPFRAPSLHEAQSNVLCELSRYSLVAATTMYKMNTINVWRVCHLLWMWMRCRVHHISAVMKCFAEVQNAWHTRIFRSKCKVFSCRNFMFRIVWLLYLIHTCISCRQIYSTLDEEHFVATLLRANVPSCQRARRSETCSPLLMMLCVDESICNRHEIVNRTFQAARDRTDTKSLAPLRHDTT